MYVDVNNAERPDFGETAKTTTRRVLQRYFDYVDILYLHNKVILTPYFLEYYMHFTISKMLYAHTNNKENS